MAPGEDLLDRRLVALAERAGPRLASAFGDHPAPGPVVAIRRLGDPHRGGRCVALIRFRSGFAVIHKPRPVASELAWNGVVRWFGERAPSGPFLAPRVMARRHGGWVEALPVRRPRAGDEARRYHRRLGVLLALFDVLEVRDVHRGNLIPVGEHPVLVDAETIAHPRLAPFRGVPSLALTGCLPEPGRLDDRSGIRAGLPRGSNDPALWVDEVVAGYREGYEVLRGRARELLAPRGPLGKLARMATRVVLRSTERYRAALRSRHEGSLEGGWPPLAAPPLPVPARRRGAVEEVERIALARGDVPVFHAYPGGQDLYGEGRLLVPGCFREPALDRITRRLGRLSRREEREMADLIRGTLLLARTGSVPGRGARGRSGRRARSR